MTTYKVYITDDFGIRALETFTSLSEATCFLLTMREMLPSKDFSIKTATNG